MEELPENPYEVMGLLLSRGIYCKQCEKWVPWNEANSKHWEKVHKTKPPKTIMY